MAKSSAERMRENRERDKKTEEERLALLLACTIKLDLYKGTDAALTRIMERSGIEERQDVLTRLIHNADNLDDEQLSSMLRLS